MLVSAVDSLDITPKDVCFYPSMYAHILIMFARQAACWQKHPYIPAWWSRWSKSSAELIRDGENLWAQVKIPNSHATSTVLSHGGKSHIIPMAQRHTAAIQKSHIREWKVTSGKKNHHGTACFIRMIHVPKSGRSIDRFIFVENPNGMIGTQPIPI